MPAILVSPWLDAGVCKTPFDHTSILRYLCDKYGMPALSKRTSPAAGALQANSFADLLTARQTPRADTPAVIKGRSMPTMPTMLKARNAIKEPSPVEGSRESLLYFVATKPKIPPAKRAIKTVKPTVAMKKISDENLRMAAEVRFAEMTKIKKPL